MGLGWRCPASSLTDSDALQIYRAVFCVAQRDFKTAASLFLDSIIPSQYELFNFTGSASSTLSLPHVSLPRMELPKARYVLRA
jgi:hypothetical protein